MDVGIASDIESAESISIAAVTAGCFSAASSLRHHFNRYIKSATRVASPRVILPSAHT